LQKELKGSVSVIIPNYNKSDWIESCVESCIAQGDYLKEIIIVDDHSTDDSLGNIEKLRNKYSSIIRFFVNPTKGANYARNFGFEQSRGEYIQWLDSDDLLLEHKFKNQLPPLVQDKADVVYSDWEIRFYEDGNYIRTEKKCYRNYDDFLEELMKDNWTSPNNYLMNRKTALKLDNGIGWNPETPVGQDREYFTMAGIQGARFVYIPGLLAVYNQQRQGTISGMKFKERLEHNQNLEARFRKEIENSNLLSKYKKDLYLRILNTHKIKACFYNNSIQLDRYISPFDIVWSLMHWKMRFIMPWLLLKKNTQFLLD